MQPIRTLIIARAWRFAAALALTSLGACHQPTLIPIAPSAVNQTTDGPERQYDLDGDGRADVAQLLGPTGRIRRVRIRRDNPDRWDEGFLVTQPTAESRHLIFILDSISYGVVAELWDQGRFRWFNPPSRLVAPFPVMTDLSLAEFFGASPCAGVESSYYDGQRRTSFVDVYNRAGNAPWLQHVDVALSPRQHGLAYLWPTHTFLHELAQAEHALESSTHAELVAYSVGSSAMGARYGRNGHVRALIDLDRFCEALLIASEGQLKITLLSDHGHNYKSGQYISLAEELDRLGYHPSRQIRSEADVVIPEFSVVTCAAIYTQQPSRVAADLVSLQGVDLAVYRERDQLVVLTQGGRATIHQRGTRFGYAAERGDPLHLKDTWAQLTAAGQVDAQGCVADEVLFEATHHGHYPDALRRLWHAFNGLMVHTPQVLVSVKEDYYCGSSTISALYPLKAAHGALGEASSLGFVLTTGEPLPETIRMGKLLGLIRN